MAMNVVPHTVPSRVAELFSGANQLTPVERLALANLLLESVLAGEARNKANWLAMSLDTFQSDWDNAEDTIYDNWKELYGVPAR
jgi:hypothetical protein